jgi:mRNA interferase MazF
MAGQRPPRIAPRIVGAAKIRGLYWCDFWQDAQLPEMWKTRPVIVVSYRNTLYGPCTVVPTSADPQVGNPWADKLSVTSKASNPGRSAIIPRPSRRAG